MIFFYKESKSKKNCFLGGRGGWGGEGFTMNPYYFFLCVGGGEGGLL